MTQERITHSKIAQAVTLLNKAQGTPYGTKGHIIYADIRGDGPGYRPSFYASIADGKGAGVTNVASIYRGETMRETYKNIHRAIAQAKGE